MLRRTFLKSCFGTALFVNFYYNRSAGLVSASELLSDGLTADTIASGGIPASKIKAETITRHIYVDETPLARMSYFVYPDKKKGTQRILFEIAKK